MRLLVRQVPGGRLGGVVAVVVGVDVTAGVLVTVTVLVLVDGGVTAVVVVTVVVAVLDEVVVVPAEITPQATRLTESPGGLLPKVSGSW